MTRANQPAFPLAWTEINAHGVEFPMIEGGMTLREYYAGLAMQGLLAGEPDLRYSLAAQQSVAHADALIAELAKGGDA